MADGDTPRYRNPNATDVVAEYMRQHHGQVVTTGRVAADLGLPSSTASACLQRLARDPSSGVARAPAGGSWVANGQARQGRAAHQGPALDVGALVLLECIGHTADGRPIVRDEQGVIFVYLVKPV